MNVCVEVLTQNEEKHMDVIETDAILQVKDVMVREVKRIDENVTIKEAANVMNKFEIGCLIAVEKGKISGIITERDLLKRVLAKGKNASKTRVRDIMTSPLIVTEPKMDLDKAVKLMFQKKIKKLPVIENKRLVGLLSLTDVARVQPQAVALFRQFSKIMKPAPKSMQKIIDRYII